MLLDKAKGFADLPPGKTRGLSQLERRFKPELGLAVLALNMHVHSRLLSREEVEPEAAFAKYGRAHGQNDTR